jgi:ribonuclease BN (tRNA processing enzyme)
VHTRRQWMKHLSTLGLLTYGLDFAAPTSAQNSPNTKIILLGTKGGPRVGAAGRKNPSTLLLINNTPYLVDCGYGTSMNMAAKVPLNSLRHIFITHLHSDHTLEAGSVIYNGWATGLNTQVDIWGPPGIQRMMNSYLDYMKEDIDVRMVDEGRPDLRQLVKAHEFSNSGVIYQDEQVTISAQRVRHPPLTHAYAFRFKTKDATIVISGDTTYSPELIEFAKGADILIHEVMYLPGVDALLKRVNNAQTLKDHLLASHSTTEEVGKVAAAAGVKKLVLSHFVPGDDNTITDEMWSEGVRKHYAGKLIIGKDLMEIGLD